MARARAQAHFFKLCPCRCKGISLSGQFQRDGNIFKRGHRRQQMKSLQDNANPAPARAGQTIFIQRAEIGATGFNPAAGGSFQPGQNGHQR